MSTLLDEEIMALVISQSNTTHVQAWFGRTACGKDCWDIHKWQYGGLTSLRWVGRLAQSTQPNHFCKGCARIYKDVNING